MDSVATYLVKSKVTSEFKSVTKELGLDDDGDKGGMDEERRKREADEELKKQQTKTQAKMREIEAEHSKKREEREKKRDEIRNKYGIGEASSTPKTNTKKEGGDKCVIS